MSKRYYLPADQIKPVAIGHGACIASDLIRVEGHKVGYMYREEPNNDTDSGWKFFAGTETQEYTDNPANFAVYDVNTIANYDPEIIPFLDAPIESALVRDPETGQFEPEHFVPAIPSVPLDSIMSASMINGLAKMPLEYEPPPLDFPNRTDTPGEGAFCEKCGKPLDVHEGETRSKTGSSLLGGLPAVQMPLCTSCLQQYDGTSSHMIWG